MSTKLATKQSSCRRRIRQFYDLLNEHDFKRCFQMIDPRIRRMPTSVTFFQYQNALMQFLDVHGSITVQEMEIKLHVGEPSTLYEGRDFALGKTTWLNDEGEQHIFLERWVREGRSWYTRSTGFVAAESKTVAAVPTAKPRSKSA